MAVGRAVVYFFREASLNLARSWKISLVAVSTIAVSLFVGGALLLLTGNAEALVDEWQSEARVVVYLRPGVTPEAAAPLGAELRRAPWATAVDAVSAVEARQRFQRTFPSVADLVQGWGEEPLPASFEVTFDPERATDEAFEAWLARLRADARVAMVDDDRDWVRQLEGVLRAIRALGLALVAILLVCAIFTIASVIRLTAYLYRDEIGIMRLVGATELFVRGPFYVEGLLQGTLGGALAVGGLWAAHASLASRVPAAWLAGALTGSFLAAGQQALLVALGAASGLVGAIASLRREEV
jgi:cell division transport system permease protein